MASFVDLAPFLAIYWPYVLLTLLLLVPIFIFLYGSPGKKQESEARPRPNKTAVTTRDKGEHPLAEFEEERSDGSLAPSLHPEDTPQVPYNPPRLSEEEMIRKSEMYYQTLNKRRSVRYFSNDPVPIKVIENVIRAAGTSPSGAHCEPWTFVVVKDPKIKTKVRDIIEEQEYHNYDRRMGEKWVNDLKFMNTTHMKSYLEEAPFLIVVMKQQYRIAEDGVKHPHYYYEISTAIAAGFLLTAIHMAGLVTVTTTPLNAGVALRELFGRPESEKVMLLFPVGYPSGDCEVPDIERKPLEEIMVVWK